MKINTLCLHNIVTFAEKAGNIPVLQVSTCYVNGFHKGDLYEDNVAPVSPKGQKGAEMSWNKAGYFEVEDCIASLRQQVERLYTRYSGEKLQEKLVDYGISQAQKYGWNDTYTFTKWMGEQLLRKYMANKSLTILRPAIVESALKGPAPGWIEGVKVADAIIMAYAQGKVHLFPGRAAGVADVIPVDLVANSIILGAAEQLWDSRPAHRVYQCCSGSSNPLGVKEMVRYVVEEASENYQKYPRLFPKKPDHPFVLVPRQLFLAGLNTLRAGLWAVDKGLSMLGRKADFNAFENIKVATKLSTIFSFYTSPNYIFHNEKLIALQNKLSETEQTAFTVDAAQINWESYFKDYHLAGLNRYSLDDRKVVKLKAEQTVKKSKAA